MMKRLIPVILMLPLVLNAADDTETAQATWKGEGELGFVSTSGNSESENLNASLSVSRELGRWKHAAAIETIRAKTEDVVSADSLVLSEKSEYSLGEKSYVFGKLRYEDDEFSGYDRQASVSFGVGSRFVENERHLLDASLGLGYRSLKERATGVSEEDGIVTADLKYQYKISESATFAESILVESGDENTHSESDTSVRAKIDGNLATKISYLVKRNSEVPPDIEKSDEIVSISLVYAF